MNDELLPDQSSHKLKTYSYSPGLLASQDLAETASQTSFSHFHFNMFVHYLLFLQRLVMNKAHTITDIGLSSINKQMGYFIKLSGKNWYI
jgi:hypothetical protein